MNNDILLSIAYLGSVQYFTKILSANKVFIEQHENYNKKSYRNRCDIYTANGQEIISIPVKKNISHKTAIKDVQIDYDTKWQKVHWKAFEASYRSSPFYEYYIDDLLRFYIRKYNFLWDFNIELLNVILNNIGISKDICFTEKYESNPKEIVDCRELIIPKSNLRINDAYFNPIPYKQVFDEKYAFIANLSIIDLLFNEGPNAIELLKQSSNSDH